MADLECKRSVCKALWSAVKKKNLEDLESRAASRGLEVVRVWRAPRGDGFKAVAARITVNSKRVLVVAFRSTQGMEEWLEYPEEYLDRPFLPHNEQDPDEDMEVFSVWSDTLDEVSPAYCLRNKHGLSTIPACRSRVSCVSCVSLEITRLPSFSSWVQRRSRLFVAPPSTRCAACLRTCTTGSF